MWIWVVGDEINFIISFIDGEFFYYWVNEFFYFVYIVKFNIFGCINKECNVCYVVVNCKYWNVCLIKIIDFKLFLVEKIGFDSYMLYLYV